MRFFSTGHNDLSEVWKSELGVSNLEKVVDDLYTKIEPLYIQLHAFIRGRLAESDQFRTVVHPSRPLPAHVLGHSYLSENFIFIALKQTRATNYFHRQSN